MPSFNTNVPHHLNGVSELPKSLRKDSNAKAQTNAYPDLAQGLIKRPPTDIVGCTGKFVHPTSFDGVYNVGGANGYDSICHTINEDGLEKYLLMISRGYDYDGTYKDNAITVYDIAERKWAWVWTDYTSNSRGWKNYSKTSNCLDFSFVTIADTTFIANAQVKVAEHDALSPDTTKTGLLSVQELHATELYWAEVDGIRLEHTSTNSTSSSALNLIATGIVKLINGNTAQAFHSTAHTKTEIASANSSFSDFKWNVTGKATGASALAKCWTKVGDVVEFTGVGGDLKLVTVVHTSGGGFWNSWSHTVTSTITMKKGSQLKIRSTTCSAGSSTGVVQFETLAGLPLLFSTVSAAAAASTWTLRAVHRAYSADLEALSAVQREHQIIISHSTGGDFSLKAGTDSKGDEPFIAVKDEVQVITDLPMIAPDGFGVKLFGSVSTGQDDYYLKFKTTGDDTWGEGNWIETLGPNERFMMDPDTMPHLLIKQSDGSFLLTSPDGTIQNRNMPQPAQEYNPTYNHIRRVNKDPIVGAVLHDPSGHLIKTAGTGANHTSYLEGTSLTVRGLEPHVKIAAFSTFKVTSTTGSGQKSYIVYSDTNADEYGVADISLGKDPRANDTQAGVLTLTTIGTPADPHWLQDGNQVWFNPAEDYPTQVWGERVAGDTLTCPMPQFVGSHITDLCVHEGRLGIVSPHGVDFSETGEFFNFFRTTVTQLLDSGPIPVTAAGAANVYIKKAVPLKQSVLLMSNNDQFSVSAAGGPFTTRNVGVYQSSRFSIDTDCAPITMHDSVYAISAGPTTSGLLEFMASDNVAKSYKGYDVATNAPTYLPIEVKQMAALPHENLIAILPKIPEVADRETEFFTAQQEIYFFKFSDMGNKRQQSALFKFDISIPTFPIDNNLGDADVNGDATDLQFIPQIRSVQAVGNKLFIQVAILHYSSAAKHPHGFGYPRSGDYPSSMYNAFLEMDFSNASDTVHNENITHLDNRCSYDGANKSSTRINDVAQGYAHTTAVTTVNGVVTDTTFKLPFMWDENTTPTVLTKSTAAAAGGTPVTIISTDGGTGTIVLNGDQRLSHLYFGINYTMEYEYHDPILKTQSQEGGPSFLQGGRHQVNRASIEFEDTGDFSVSVDTLGRSGAEGDGVFTYPFTADADSLDATTEGGLTTQTGTFSIPIRSKAGKFTMKITSSSHKPVKILSTEYENTFNSSRGIR